MANGTEVRSCVRVEVAVLGSPSLISLMVSVDVKHHLTQPRTGAQEWSDEGGGARLS